MWDIFTASNVLYCPKMGIVKAKKLCVRSKTLLFSKKVQDYGSRSADICTVMQAVGAFSFYVITKISILKFCWFWSSRKFKGRTIPRIFHLSLRFLKATGEKNLWSHWKAVEHPKAMPQWAASFAFYWKTRYLNGFSPDSSSNFYYMSLKFWLLCDAIRRKFVRQWELGGGVVA